MYDWRVCDGCFRRSRGTLWLDVARRQWSPQMLQATYLDESHMPRLLEGTEPSGTLRPPVAASLGLPIVSVAAGGGDNAAGAVGVGVIDSGQALLSLGTSGVIFSADHEFRPNPARAMHAFCHCLPRRWHEMSVTLSAAASVDWVARLTGYADVSAALADAERAQIEPESALVESLEPKRATFRRIYSQVESLFPKDR